MGWLQFDITGNAAYDFFFSLTATINVIIYLLGIVAAPLFRR